MKIKNYKNTPNKISYTACYDCLEMEIIHERTEFGVSATDIEDFLEKWLCIAMKMQTQSKPSKIFKII